MWKFDEEFCVLSQFEVLWFEQHVFSIGFCLDLQVLENHVCCCNSLTRGFNPCMISLLESNSGLAWWPSTEGPSNSRFGTLWVVMLMVKWDIDYLQYWSRNFVNVLEGKLWVLVKITLLDIIELAFDCFKYAVILCPGLFSFIRFSVSFSKKSPCVGNGIPDYGFFYIYTLGFW